MIKMIKDCSLFDDAHEDKEKLLTKKMKEITHMKSLKIHVPAFKNRARFRVNLTS